MPTAPDDGSWGPRSYARWQAGLLRAVRPMVHMLIVSLGAVTAMSACSAGESGPKVGAQKTSPAGGIPSGDSYGDRSLRHLLGCMADKGWTLSYDPQTGGLNGEVPPEQRESHETDAELCRAEFEKDNPPKAPSEADYRVLYQAELRTAECLSQRGYPQLATPISEQQYVNEYASGRAPSWYAYQALGDAPSQDTLAAMEKECPQPRLDH